MSLKNSQYDEIMRGYSRRQLYHRHRQEERIEEAYARIPRLAEIDHEISSLSVQKAHQLLGSSSAKPLNLREAIRELSDERRLLLTASGYPEDYLELHYDCPVCRDTGYNGTEKCSCFKRAAVSLLYDCSHIGPILQRENFDTFSYDYYPEEVINESTGLSALETAKAAVCTAHNFINHFDERFENLFLYGDTGVGKTFLSHCIARELIDASFSVIYFSAHDLFEQMAERTFSRTWDSEESHDLIFSCDLLIIDDLGTELTNSFVASQLFLCINERLIQEKSTLISTNLSLGYFAETYSERVFSRISSNYTMLKLIGHDIRIQKKLKGGTH